MPQVLIASRISTLTVGGLASYQRGLARELEAHGTQVSLFCSADVGAAKFWMRLASRPAAFGLLERLISLRYRSTLAELRQKKFDAVHFVGTGWDYSGFAMRDLARELGARFTIWPAVHPGAWGDDAIDLRLYQEADAVLCQSDEEARHLVQLGLSPSRVVRCGLPAMCLPNGKADRFGTNGHPVVLFLGRRDEGKGYPALLKAWPQVRAVHPSAVLMLAGPGDHGVHDESIRDLGIPDEETKADALAACTVFCLPSAHESFGIVFVEAWSYGKPVICGPAPASRELVRPGETGLWADQSPESIAQCIIEALGHPDASRRMGEAGREFQKNHLTWDKIVGIHQAAFGL